MRTACTCIFLCLIIKINYAQWTPVETGISDDINIQDIDIIDENTAWAVTGTAYTTEEETLTFLRTTDGNTWITGTINTPDAAGNTASNISALSANDAWVAMFNYAGGGGIFHTSDGGANWEHQGTAIFAGPAGFPNVVHMFDLNNGFAMGDPNDGYFEIYTTINGGALWTRVADENIPDNGDEFGIIDCYDVAGETILFGTTNGNIYKSQDMGYTWTLHTSGLSYINDIALSDENNGIALGTDEISQTIDGGETWNGISYDGDPRDFTISNVPGISAFVTGEAPFATYYPNTGSSYSLDGGNTWIEIDDESLITTVDFLNPTTGWAGGFNEGDESAGLYKWEGDLSVAIPEINVEAQQIIIYPNPATNEIQIQINSSQQNTSLRILNSLGDIVLEVNKFNDQNLDISNLSPGIYFIDLLQGENALRNKFVKE